MARQLVSKLLPWLTSDSGDHGTRARRDLLTSVLQSATKGNAESVLSVIDNYAKHATMEKHLGEEQGSILDAELKKNIDSIVALELGAYCGYSTIRMASAMTNSDSKLISLEKDTYNYGIAKKLIEHAGISSKVTLLKGTLMEAGDELDQLFKQMPVRYFNFIFLNHSEDYLHDFMLLKKASRLGKGTVIVVNSEGFPQDHDYLKYLKDHPEELDSPAHGSDVNGSSLFPSTMIVSTYKVDLNPVV